MAFAESLDINKGFPDELAYDNLNFGAYSICSSVKNKWDPCVIGSKWLWFRLPP